jgi:SAM-dependent methyltransferase
MELMASVTGRNLDPKTIEGFGQEWSAYDQSGLPTEEHARLFQSYFSCFPFDRLPADSEGFDLGCGSGRWAQLAAPRVGMLHCIDPAAAALEVAKKKVGGMPNVRFHLAAVDEIPLPDDSQDFGYSLGVLHHIPNTEAALRSCVRKLKPGAPFLLYLYYRFDNRPSWFKALWSVTDVARAGISRMPFRLRRSVATTIAALIYLPLARTAAALERRGRDVANYPLAAYRHNSFYTMRTDALDRFGTRLEQRFTREEISGMMQRTGLGDIVFSEHTPYWVACGYRKN